jgi:hypothetical protein
MKRMGVANLRFSRFVVQDTRAKIAFPVFVKLSWDLTVCTM